MNVGLSAVERAVECTVERTLAQRPGSAVSRQVTTPACAPARIAMLGTGNVGRAVLDRLQGWSGSSLGQRLSLVHVANTRVAFVPCGTQGAGKLRQVPVPVGEGLALAVRALGHDGTRILIDATASEEVADRHARWLSQGIHVVTACKLGQGTTLQRWQSIHAGCERGGTRYGDSATVGAGLPLLRSIRDLRAGGDRIHAIAGVVSGSLAWLFHHFDGRLPFSGFVNEACKSGYTEPDPREDLSGEDVRRKLLILARAAGVELEAEAVDVESLVPEGLAALPRQDVDAGLPLLDACLRKRYAQAWKRGEKLHYIARLEDGQAKVGLESLAPDHPLAGGTGTDNRVAIWSDRYHGQPLLVQGPGAGAGVTAAALLDDALSIQVMLSMGALSSGGLSSGGLAK